jgi:AraC family transcriptional regulator
MERERWLPEPVVRAIERVEERLETRLTLQDMAAAAGLSPYHFHRRFRETMDETPAAFVERLRVERAALLLLAETTPITELAWDVGFRNPETFARRFRARFGVTARSYRRRQLELWERLGLRAGTDPGGPGGAIRIRRLPALPVVFRRAVGHEEGFVFDDDEAWPRPGGAPRKPARVGVTLDWPGITPPGRVRQDWAVEAPGPVGAGGGMRKSVAGRTHATIAVRGNGPVPTEVYQRLFVRLAGGRNRLAPGPLLEIWRDGLIEVAQPVVDAGHASHSMAGGGCR